MSEWRSSGVTVSSASSTRIQRFRAVTITTFRCAHIVVFVTVKSVVIPPRSSVSTSKYGSRSVAAGSSAMSQLSLFFVVAACALNASAASSAQMIFMAAVR